MMSRSVPGKESSTFRLYDCRFASTYRELSKDILDVKLDGGFAQGEISADDFIGVPEIELLDHFSFAIAE